MPASNPKSWRFKWHFPGTKGMVSAADLRNLTRADPGYASYLRNADLSKEFGGIRKAPGFDRHDADNPLPDNFPPVLSMGWFTYIDVWRLGTSEDPSNSRMGRLIVQCNGNPGGTEEPFDFYYRDYSYDDDEWLQWEGPFTNENIYGAIKPDRIRWTVFPGVMRGACGIESDSYPLWIGYVDRNANDDNGLFNNYLTDEDRKSITNMHISEAMPRSVYGFDGIPTYGHFQHPESMGGYKDERVRILAVPIFDGHQISDISKTVGYSGAAKQAFCVPANASYPAGVHEAFKANLIVSLAGANFSERLTGFNIYESRQAFGEGSEGSVPFSAWKHIKYIDIRTGNDTPFLSLKGIFDSVENKVIVYGLKFAEDAFNNYYVNVAGGKYKVTNTVVVGENTEIYFTHSLSGTLDFTINEKWGTVLEETAQINLYFDGTAFVASEAPNWLPDPNKLDLDTFTIIEDKHSSRVMCNYKQSILFEERHIVGDVEYDGVRYPLMVRWGFPTNDPFAGHDLFPNYLMIPSHEGDEITGFAQTLNVLTIFTREKIFRYVFEDGIPRLQESPYSIGLYAPDSLVTINGIHWFLGQRGPILSVFIYDGIHKPENIGEVIRPDMLFILSLSGIQPKLAIGWYDERTNDYGLSLTRYTAGEIWELSGGPGSASRSVAAGQPSQPKTPDRIVPSAD